MGMRNDDRLPSLPPCRCKNRRGVGCDRCEGGETRFAWSELDWIGAALGSCPGGHVTARTDSNWHFILHTLDAWLDVQNW